MAKAWMPPDPCEPPSQPREFRWCLPCPGPQGSEPQSGGNLSVRGWLCVLPGSAVGVAGGLSGCSLARASPPELKTTPISGLCFNSPTISRPLF